MHCFLFRLKTVATLRKYATAAYLVFICKFEIFHTHQERWTIAIGLIWIAHFTKSQRLSGYYRGVIVPNYSQGTVMSKKACVLLHWDELCLLNKSDALQKKQVNIWLLFGMDAWNLMQVLEEQVRRSTGRTFSPHPGLVSLPVDMQS